jgi:hypothetical protein
MGELLKTTNPDGSSITRKLLFDGTTPSSLTLADSSNVVKTSVAFSDFVNPYAQPLEYRLGNGVISKSEITEEDAMLVQSTLSKADGTVLLNQTWDYDTFHKITSYYAFSDVPRISQVLDKSQYDSSGEFAFTSNHPGP